MEELRSRSWFGKKDKMGFIYRSWMKNQGFPDHLFDGRPVIGICNTWSELTPCNAHLRAIADRARRGAKGVGGFPRNPPTIVVSGGAMLNGKVRGEDIGSGTHIWKFTEQLKSGEITEEDLREA